MLPNDIGDAFYRILATYLTNSSNFTATNIEYQQHESRDMVRVQCSQNTQGGGPTLAGAQ